MTCKQNKICKSIKLSATAVLHFKKNLKKANKGLNLLAHTYLKIDKFYYKISEKKMIK